MISVRRCRYSFPDTTGHEHVPVLGGLEFSVDDGEFLCLLGPSGCGKTTILRMLAGLVMPDSGEIQIEGRPVTGPGRDRAMVFQEHALLPWLDVVGNVSFGLTLRGVSREEQEARASRLLQAVGLTAFRHHRPLQLSGGMKQRVGLARALAVEPAILLMDEPFGSLDSQTRRALQEDLLVLQATTRKTVVFVTHSVDEAVRLGDRILLLGHRPTTVEAEFVVPLPRPRPPELDGMAAFVALKHTLWQRVKAQRVPETPA